MPKLCQEPSVSTARIAWHDGAPISEQYQQPYCSLANGLDEKRYVFLEQNFLPQRWNDLGKSDVFTIVETGFGIGLNFLTTWQLWSRSEEPKPRLAFVSVEKHPIRRSDLEQCLSLWPELGDLRQQLIDAYPILIKGNHQMHFQEGRIQLNLIIGDVNEDLCLYPFSADCWFLDGFAPSKNPDMWQVALFKLMRHRSQPKATFAAHEDTEFIRRALSENGFDVERIKGFVPNKVMLRGQVKDTFNAGYFPAALPRWTYSESQNSAPKIHTAKPNLEMPDVIVIGAGLAGITTAHALANSGFRVTILERNDRPMAGASGQSQLALFAKLPSIMNKESRFLAQCLLFSQRHFRELQTHYSDIPFWHPTGLLQLIWNETEQRRLKTLLANTSYPESFLRAVDASEASRLCGIDVHVPGLWFEHSGWLDPHNYAEALLSHPNITLRCNTPCLNLHQKPDGSWLVETLTQTFKSTRIVLASAHETSTLQSFAPFPLKTLRGQVTTISSENLVAARSVVCGEGYLCPPHKQAHHFGATYDLISKHGEVINEDNQLNIDAIQQWLPDWLTPDHLNGSVITGSAGMRCTTPDYFPIAGQIHNPLSMAPRFSHLRHNANACKTIHGDYFSGLFINVGHGSKGMTTIPACAEWISSLIAGKPGLFNDEAQSAIHPARFMIRSLIKRQL